MLRRNFLIQTLSLSLISIGASAAEFQQETSKTFSYWSTDKDAFEAERPLNSSDIDVDKLIAIVSSSLDNRSLIMDVARQHCEKTNVRNSPAEAKRIATELLKIEEFRGLVIAHSQMSSKVSSQMFREVLAGQSAKDFKLRNLDIRNGWVVSRIESQLIELITAASQA